MKMRYWLAGAYGLAGAALAARLLVRPRDVRWEEHREHLSHAEKSRFVEVGGARIHYHEAGRAGDPVLVLVHGFVASNFVWDGVLVPLAEAGFRVVAPDLVGFGFSAKPRAAEYTVEAQARNLVGLLDALGVERAALVGSSYGGAVAAVCALDFPARVERLVLVGAVSNDEILRHPLLRVARARVLGDLLSPVFLDLRRLAKRRKHRLEARRGGAAYDARRTAAQYRALAASDTHRAAVRTARLWSAARVEREAHKILQPTLIVWGDGDQYLPVRHAERLHRAVPHSRLFVFRGAGHTPQEERPAEFARLVSDFCRDELRTVGG
jgi:pimeloyl-ACP methyl ester carboxylesterase